MLNQSPKNILIATSNKGKLKEVKSHLSSLDLNLRDLTEFPSLPQPEENGDTFTDNAIIKAKYYSAQTTLWSLADDSGLEVDALDGKPGVYSARYAGVEASDEERNNLLLSELIDVRENERTARFVCVLAFCSPDEELVKITKGVVEGRIAFESKGSNGFGYDPVFIPSGFSQTFGELSSDIKQKISHRAVALTLFSEFFSDFLATHT